MRSLQIVLKGVFLLFLVFCVNLLFSQPVNDNVGNAVSVIVDGPAVSTNILGASTEVGENAILPPIDDACLPHSWCDLDGITASVWYSFLAPASGIVLVDVCGSSFDTQLAVYSSTDVNDFSTFSFLDASDDTPNSDTPGLTCGPPADPDDPMEVYGLASSLTLECLVPGETYYVLVDKWSSDGLGVPSDQDVVSIAISEVLSQGINVSISNIVANPPYCQGGNTGNASLTIEGNWPIQIIWSNGDVGETIWWLLSGTYTATVTDACGGQATTSVLIEQGAQPNQISIDTVNTIVVPPSVCGDNISGGTISLVVSEGIYPYEYFWSDGSTAALRDSLSNGAYSVTISDLCSNNEAVENFFLGFSAGGPFLQGGFNENCIVDGGTFPLGCDPEYIGGGSDRYSFLSMEDTEEVNLNNIVACSSPIPEDDPPEADNGYLRVVDLENDFGLSGTVYISSFEVALTERDFGLDWNGQFEGRIRLFESDNPDLSVASLNEVAVKNFIIVENVGLDGQQLDDVQFMKIPLNIFWNVDEQPLLVFDLYNPDASTLNPDLDDQIDLRWAGFDLPDTDSSKTYFYSEECGIPFPGQSMPSLAFPNQEIYFAFFLSDSTNQLIYSWEAEFGGVLSSTMISNPFALAEGRYNLTITDANCATTFTESVYVLQCFSNIVEANDALIQVLPNPSSGRFNLQYEGENRECTMDISDINGSILVNKKIQMNRDFSYPIDLGSQAKGIYILKLTYDDSFEIHRLIVQ